MPKTFLLYLTLTLLAVPLSHAQGEKEVQSKTVPDSINLVWKKVALDFARLADAMPEDKWKFKPTQGEFTGARTFAEQVKHVACANEAWAKKILEEKQPEHCDQGGPNLAKTKTARVLRTDGSRHHFDQSPELTRTGAGGVLG
jgi:DinB family protein